MRAIKAIKPKELKFIELTSECAVATGGGENDNKSVSTRNALHSRDTCNRTERKHILAVGFCFMMFATAQPKPGSSGHEWFITLSSNWNGLIRSNCESDADNWKAFVVPPDPDLRLIDALT